MVTASLSTDRLALGYHGSAVGLQTLPRFWYLPDHTEIARVWSHLASIESRSSHHYWLKCLLIPSSSSLTIVCCQVLCYLETWSTWTLICPTKRVDLITLWEQWRYLETSKLVWARSCKEPRLGQPASASRSLHSTKAPEGSSNRRSHLGQCCFALSSFELEFS